MAWDTRAFQRARKFKGHKGIVNSVGVLGSASDERSGILVSGSDDMTVRVWDERDKLASATFELDYQVTSVAISNDYVFFGGLDNMIKAVNRRKNQIEFACLGHTDTITGIALHG